jgi:hypothetical protein
VVIAGAIAQVKQSWKKLRNRYGTRYSYAMLGVVFFTFWLPIPGSSLVSVALIMVVAEAHRAISKRGGLAEAIADVVVVVEVNKPFWARGLWTLPFGGMGNPSIN